MQLSISPELLDKAPLTGRSAATSLWRRKTKNLFRGVFELECTGKTPSDISALVLNTVKVEYEPGFIVPFAFGAVLYFNSEAPPPSELEYLVDDRARNRGTWQWIVVVNRAKQEAYGIHMWARGYLTPVFEAVLKHHELQGYTSTTVVKQPSKFWFNLWATTRSLLATRKALAAVGVVLGAAYLVFKAFAPQ